MTRTFTTPEALGGLNIRVVTMDGNPWFVAADVCRALGLAPKVGGFDHHCRSLASDQRRVMSLAAFAPVSGIRGKGRGGLRPTTPIIWVSESGLYRLVMRSDKPEARDFQEWVTRSVLPTIRKTGSYVMGEEKVRTGSVQAASLNAHIDAERIADAADARAMGASSGAEGPAPLLLG